MWYLLRGRIAWEFYSLGHPKTPKSYLKRLSVENYKKYVRGEAYEED